MQDRVQTYTDLMIVDSKIDDYHPLLQVANKLNLPARLYQMGEEAFRVVSSVFSGLWIVGIQLEDMSGLEFLAWLRERDSATTVFLVSESYAAEEETAARVAGASLYLCKPPQTFWLDWLDCKSHQESGVAIAGVPVHGRQAADPLDHQLNRTSGGPLESCCLTRLRVRLGVPLS